MDRIIEIEKMYFDNGLSVIDIAAELEVTKQYISKVLKNTFNDEYTIEKEKRKFENREKRNKTKTNNIREKRKLENQYDVTADELRRQQEISARCMSKSSYLSSRSAVYSNMNAYTRSKKGNSLVYDSKIGARPNDLPKTFSLEIDIY